MGTKKTKKKNIVIRFIQFIIQFIDKHWPRVASGIAVVVGILAIVNFCEGRPEFYLDSSKINISLENNTTFYLELQFKNVGKRKAYNVFSRGFIFDKNSLDNKELDILGIILSENIPSGEIFHYKVNPFKVAPLKLNDDKYLIIYFRYQDKWQYWRWVEQYFIWNLNYKIGMRPLTKKEREKIENPLKIKTKELLRKEFNKEYK